MTAVDRTLLEREHELGRLDALLARARAGAGGSALIEGHAGIGKTALLAEARRRASGFLVLRARASELEREFGWGVVRQLLERTSDHHADGSAALGLDGANAEPFAVLHRLYWRVANLAEDRPVALLVDDAQWADAPSLRFLAFLATRLRELSVALIVASRPTPSALHPDETLRPAPLTRAAVEALVGDEARACFEATRGNPFLVGQWRAGDGTGLTILERLGRLPDAALRLARAVAVLDRSELLTAADVAGLDPATASEAADVLVGAGILEPGRPLTLIHPLMRSSLYETLSAADRDAAHRRAASVLEPRRAVEHLLKTEGRGDQATVDVLVGQARAAEARGASGVALLKRALAEPPLDPGPLVLELGIAEDRAGLPAVHLRKAVELGVTDAAVMLAHVLSRTGRAEEAVATIDAAGLPDDVRDLAAVTVGMIDACSAPALEDRVRALLARAEDPDASRALLAVVALLSLQRNDPGAIASARRALADAPLPAPTDLPWFVAATATMVFAEAGAEVLPLLDHAVFAFAAQANGPMLSAALTPRAIFALRRGDLASAEADARLVLDTAELAVPPMYRQFCTGVLVDVLVERGELEAAARAAEGVAEDTSVPAAFAREARGRLRLAQRRVDEGVADLRAAASVFDATAVHSPAFARCRGNLAEALGDAALAEGEVARARAFGAPATLCATLRSLARVADDEAQFVAAVEAGRRADARLELAHALVGLGALLRRSNRRVAARDVLSEGLELARRCTASALADRALAELGATGARARGTVVDGVAALTASERRVAELARDGLTNREIAQALFVTVRTVEGHLTSAYRKLDVGSRDALAGRLSSGDR